MSELGPKEGQGQDEKTPFFDSSKITDKKTTEHFSNVEGAAERAKQAERARIAAEKEAREVHAADVRAASEQMKKAQKAESGKKGGIVKFLSGGWHKIVTIVILLGLIAGGIFLIINSPEEPYSSKKEKDIVAFAAAGEVESKARTVFDIDSNEETYREAKNIYESAIEKSDKREKVFLKIMYMVGGFSPTIASYVSLKRNNKVRSFKEWIKRIFDIKHNISIYMLVGLFVLIYYALGCTMNGFEFGAPIFMVFVIVPMMLFGGGNGCKSDFTIFAESVPSDESDFYLRICREIAMLTNIYQKSETDITKVIAFANSLKKMADQIIDNMYIDLITEAYSQEEIEKFQNNSLK